MAGSLIVNFVLPDLIRGSIAALAIAIVAGGLIGLIAGTINRQRRRSLTGSILGSFWGVLLVAGLPLGVVPGLIGGGPYAGIYILLLGVVLLPLGLAIGATLGILLYLRCSPPQIRRVLTWVVLLGYSLLAIALSLSWYRYCSRNYCEALSQTPVLWEPVALMADPQAIAATIILL